MSISSSLGAERSVELSAGTIRYREAGAGPPIVFLHEYPAGGDTWRKVVPLLADRHRCLTPDWPYGVHAVAMRPEADLTPPGLARILLEFLDALDLRDVTLASSGGAGVIAEIAAAERPERIGRLVRGTGDALANFVPPTLLPLIWFASVPSASWLFLQACRVKAVRRAWFRLGCKRIPDDAVIENYVGTLIRNPAARRDMRKSVSSVHKRHSLAAIDALSTRDIPVLLPWAPEDLVFPLSDGEEIARRLPNARLELVHDCRTFVGEDQPGRFAQLTADFVAETSQARAA